jgi:endonuclease/exonuclease/phosphatase family metal-dependent hydrolase
MRYHAALSFAFLACACSRNINRADPISTQLEMHRPAKVHGDAHGTLRVATYNVHGESAKNILRGIRGDLRLRRADILFLQEIEVDHEDSPRKLAELLDRSYVYAPGYKVGENGSHGVAIISRFALSDPEVIELPRQQVVFNSARRVAIAVTIHLDAQPVRIFSVHLDNRLNPADRAAQLAPVLAAATRTATVPAIIAGDMNTSPFCWIGHVVPIPCGIQDNRLEAAVRARGFETPVRDSGATSKWLAMRLDAIYTRHLDVADFGVSDVVRVSDHLPLWADVTVRGHQAGRVGIR